jgi:7-cyano-7-deazaguanine reductase
MKNVEDYASVHLGTAGDGTVVNPYVTPDEVDPTLLVGIPRILNRTQYNINEKELPFVGVDAWNAYEFSTLLSNGFPVSGWLKFCYAASSPNIVESKSVKLYLNSYNMAKLIDTIDELYVIEDKIERDLSDVVGADVYVGIALGGDIVNAEPFRGVFYALEDLCDVEKMQFTEFNESSDILEVVPIPKNILQAFRSSSLRSNCRVTNQPDWGDVYIKITGPNTVTPESLLKYIVSMRKENHFHEEICECIYKRLYDLLKPVDLFVSCLYTRRGGIDINPTRATYYSDIIQYAYNLTEAKIFCAKSMRQ